MVHSRAQASISLSSMEAKILAATSLLVQGIMVTQFLLFLLGDAGGLGNNQQVQMRLRLDSTSAQSFFDRLGPGRAKHLSTRLLWSQQAMRRKLFLVERVSTKENPADLNTKPLSRERREYLMKKIGLVSETFNDDGMHGNNNVKLKHVVRAISAVLMAGQLQGCTSTSLPSSMWSSPLAWTATTWWTLTKLVLATLVLYLVDKNDQKMEAKMKYYKEVWQAIKDSISLSDREDPLAENLPDAREDPHSGVWYRHEDGEEEAATSDVVEDGIYEREVSAEEVQRSVDRLMETIDSLEGQDREATPRPRRTLTSNGTHGATMEVMENQQRMQVNLNLKLQTEFQQLKKVPQSYLQLYPGVPGEGDHEEDDDDAWIHEMNETPSERYRRYCQSGQDEVPDPDECADIHFGPSSSRARSRSRSNGDGATPTSRRMPAILAAQRDRRLAEEMAEAMVSHAEEDRERRGVRQFLQSSSSRPSRPIPTNDDENYHQDSIGLASFFHIGLVPRELSAFEDYRWDLIGQGQGPETIVVHNSRDLSNSVASCRDPVERFRAQRILRHLHGLLVMLQSGDPERWISAAQSMMDWLDADRDWSFFDMEETERGSNREEGEEEECRSDDNPIDPQDQYDYEE